MNICQYCNKDLSSKYYLQKHEKICIKERLADNFTCQYCDKVLSSKQSFQKHEKTCKNKDILKCQHCDKLLTSNSYLEKHEKTCKHNKETLTRQELEDKLKVTRQELEDKLKVTRQEFEEKLKVTEQHLEKQKLKEQYDKKELSLLNSEKIDIKIKYEKEINDLKKINNEYIQFNKETLKSVVKTNTELSKKTNINITGSRIITNTINTSIPLTVEVSKKILANVFKYHQNVIDNDDDDNLITSNAEMVNVMYMTNDLNKILAVTDTSRNILKYNIIDEKTNEIKTIKDPKGKCAVSYLIDNNIEELQNIAGSASVKRAFIVKVMNKDTTTNAPDFFPILNKYGKSIEYFTAISNKDASIIEDLGIQLVKKSLYKDHKEINDQKEEIKEDILLKCQNVIMKLKIYTEDNYQDILTGNAFQVNIWLRAALKELNVIKEWYVSDSLYGTLCERRSEDYIAIKDDEDGYVKLSNFEVMRMLKMIMFSKLPNYDNIGIDGYVEKYMKWLCKSYNTIYKNMDDELKENIIQQSIDQMKKNITMYNLDFDNDKEELFKNWIKIISG